MSGNIGSVQCAFRNIVYLATSSWDGREGILKSVVETWETTINSLQQKKGDKLYPLFMGGFSWDRLEFPLEVESPLVLRHKSGLGVAQMITFRNPPSWS